MSSSIGERRARRVRMVLFGAAVVGTLIGINTFLLHLSGDPLADVRAYYDAGARLNAGQPLYVQTATVDDPSFYRYPPLLAIFFRPLALLPYATAAAIWEALVIASFVATVIRIRPDADRLLVFGMLAMTWLWSLAIGQAQVPLTLFTLVGAPWSVALATNIKVFPVLIGVWWLSRRDWRALAWLVAWLVGLLAFQFLVTPSDTIAFFGTLNTGQVGDVHNVSPYAISPSLWLAVLAAGAVIAFRLGPTRWGWPAAVALSVFTNPRLLLYQLMTLLAALRNPGERPREAPP
jgi:glycosyl transferase family 87